MHANDCPLAKLCAVGSTMSASVVEPTRIGQTAAFVVRVAAEHVAEGVCVLAKIDLPSTNSYHLK